LVKGVVEYLGEQSRDLPWTQIEKDVVVGKICVQKLADLEVVRVIRVVDAVLIYWRSKVNLGSNFVEPVEVLDLIVIWQSVPRFSSKNCISVRFKLFLVLFLEQFLLVSGERLCVGAVNNCHCKLVVLDNLVG